MSGRLQLLEQKLLAIDGAGFQNLCDTYLVMRENEYSSLNRTGSQLGKLKTIIGTPDSFMRLSDNKLAYIEYTTQSTSLVNKIKDDIDKCLDESKTGVIPSKIHKIIVCFNSRLKVDEETTLQEYVLKKKVNLELIGIDTISLDIMSKYYLLARDFLGMSLDTGQILPFDIFIKEYNNKANKLSTPLDNLFFHRQLELKSIQSILTSKSLLILSGASGVGKTKIGIEAINVFKDENPDYTSYVITKKDVDIYEDLKIQLKDDKDYILLIDDANRQLPNLSQIFGFFKSKRKGNLKLIITVRNYALSDIYNLSYDFDCETIDIPKFSDEEIIDILKSDSFKIINNNYQKKIVQIADGNARLAIMGARLALEKELEFLLGDVGDLFESYFKSYAIDFDLFSNKDLLKSLALVSFFYTIDRENRSFINKILLDFNLDYYKFNEAIEQLHQKELVEIQYNHIRISEQVMATYFFYIVFIRDGLLSFETLLFNYFETHKYHIKDSIIPANNSFGYEKVLSKINPVIDKYIVVNKGDDSKLLEFLDVFWFYKPDATLAYFFNKTNLIEEPKNPIYSGFYETNDFVHNREQTIDYLSRFFRNYGDSFIPSIELGFEYVRKRPEHLAEFVRRIRETLLFDEPDEKYAYKRQSTFINLLKEKIKEGFYHYSVAFFELAKTFLKHSFHITHGGRKNSITFYDYPITDSEEIREIRKDIWETLFYCFKESRGEVVTVINEYKPEYRNRNPKIIDFDLSLLIPFISEYFSPKSFNETFVVNELINSLNREKEITDLSYKSLKSEFNTLEYRNFRKIDWNRLRDKDEYDYTDWRKYEKLKAENLKENFTYSSCENFNSFFDSIENVLKVSEISNSQIENSIDIIISENFKNNNEVGFNLLKQYLEKNYDIRTLYKTLFVINNITKQWSLSLWKLLKNWENENSINWKLDSLVRLPNEHIDNYYYNEVLDTIKSITKPLYLDLDQLSKFHIIDEFFLKKVIDIISNKIESKSIRIIFSDFPFTDNLGIFKGDFDLIKKSYFQQFEFGKSGSSFDYQKKGFKSIYNKYPEFLFDFFFHFYTKYDVHRDVKSLDISFIWDNPKDTSNIEKIIKLLIEKEQYIGLGEHSVSALFYSLNNDQQKHNAFVFIKDFISKNAFESDNIQIIFDTVKECLVEKYEELFHRFLDINSDLDFFKKIDWIGNAGVQMGEVIWGELYAKKWTNLLENVDRFNSKLIIIPIKSYIKSKIQEQYRSAESERMRKFIMPNRL
jgi:Novel STAND NTPase 3